MESDLPFIIAFSVFPGIGPMRFRLLYDYFGSAKKAWQASQSEFTAVGLGPITTQKFFDFKEKFSIDGYLEQLAKKHIRTISFIDSLYPQKLAQISDAPYVLYCAGDAPLSLLSDLQMIAVVGTRKITPYGKEVTQRLVEHLVRANCVIVSGMALGVDTIAHQTAIDSKGKTIAVLGCGVDIIAPTSNTLLYYNIQKSGGLIISEMPLGHQPNRGLFPARNRIVSGLSAGVEVTEGAENIGALITASNAATQGREVFAVPGSITNPMSRGPAKLLKQGATLVESADDILLQLNWSNTSSSKDSRSFSRDELWIVNELQKGPKHIDELIRISTVSPSELFVLLTRLELSGIMRKADSEAYILI